MVRAIEEYNVTSPGSADAMVGGGGDGGSMGSSGTSSSYVCSTVRCI